MQGSHPTAPDVDVKILILLMVILLHKKSVLAKLRTNAAINAIDEKDHAIP